MLLEAAHVTGRLLWSHQLVFDADGFALGTYNPACLDHLDYFQNAPPSGLTLMQMQPNLDHQATQHPAKLPMGTLLAECRQRSMNCTPTGVTPHMLIKQTTPPSFEG